MAVILKIIARLVRANWNTLRFNFHYFSFREAIKLPVDLSSNVLLLQLKGTVQLPGATYYRRIRIGYGDVGIFDQRYSRSIWEVSGAIVFRGNANIGHGSKISVGENARFEIGNNFIVSAESGFVCMNEISIGNDCLFSWECLVMDTDFHKVRDAANQIVNAPAPVKIGDQVWVGTRCLILKGAGIPSGSVIAAGSLVNKPLVGEKQVFAGNPAKPVKDQISWEL
ncbi:MAG: acyltransferase [Ferruginibacter sp.]|nr:acyltransferase [Ferruginibacter sp.]